MRRANVRRLPRALVSANHSELIPRHRYGTGERGRGARRDGRGRHGKTVTAGQDERDVVHEGQKVEQKGEALSRNGCAAH
jgi:hypothetical protein